MTMIRAFRTFISDIWFDRKIIWKLSINDFKARFSSSYLGIIWAYVTPLITMLVFWFVFQVGLRSPDISQVPFIVWFAPAYLIWMFFMETLTMGTNSIKEYGFLVKKVKFRVSIIPLIKILSGCFVHLFFIFFLFILVLLCRIPITIYSVQVLYYFACTIILLTGLSWLVSAITPFVSDIQSIVDLLLQLCFWATPIVWNPNLVTSKAVNLVLKINPMYYICRGYRDAFIDGVWFWQRGYTNLMFWSVTVVLFVVGALVFRKLRPHFADVL